jgi:hypothetical protein
MVDKTKKVLRQLRPQKAHKLTPIGTEIILPNHSGDHAAGRILKAPTIDNQMVNKKYVDDQVAAAAEVAGSDGQIQYNDGGSAFGGDSELFWDDTNKNLLVGTSTRFGEGQVNIYTDADSFDSGTYDIAAPLVMQADYASGECVLKGRSAGSDLAYSIFETNDIGNSSSLWFGSFKNGVFGATDTCGMVSDSNGTGTTKNLTLSADDSPIGAYVPQLTIKANTDFVGINKLDPAVALDVVGAGAFTLDVVVPDEAYSSGWNASLEVPTKNAIYDKIEVVNVKTMMLVILDDATATAVGDKAGGVSFVVPPALNGMNLTGATAVVATAGTTGTLDIQIHNITDAADMLTNKIQVASAAVVSDGGESINTSNDDVVTNDRIRVDVDVIHTTPAAGLIVMLEFTLP